MTDNLRRIYDDLCALHVGTLAASAVASSARNYFDTGGGYTEMELVLDVSAIEIISNDELYKFAVQGSAVVGFGTLVELAHLELGAKEVTPHTSDNTTGRYIIPFNNMFNGTVYRYVRLYATISGTIGTGITIDAFLTKRIG